MAPTRSTPNIAARVALAYAVVASLWIVGSSLVVIGLPEPLGGFVEVAKGLLFVLVTALLLYLLLARWTGTLIDRLSRTDDALDQIRQISDCLPEGIVLLDADKNVGFLNPAAETLLCPGAPDVRGRRFVDVCEEAGGEGCAQVLPQLLGVGDLPGGLQIRGPDGAARTLVMRAASLDSSKPEEGWVLALADDTEAGASRRRSERLLAGYRFASLVSSETERAHDARQLLGRSCELAVASGGFVGAWAVVRDRSAGGFVDAGMVGLGPSAPRGRGHANQGGGGGRAHARPSIRWRDHLPQPCDRGPVVGLGSGRTGEQHRLVHGVRSCGERSPARGSRALRHRRGLLRGRREGTD